MGKHKERRTKSASSTTAATVGAGATFAAGATSGAADAGSDLSLLVHMSRCVIALRC